MNPGPAPRPPNQPRLNLVPSTANVPGNLSQLSLQSSGMRSTSSLVGTSMTGSGSVSPGLTRYTSNGSEDGRGGIAVVKEGTVKSKEDGFGSFWKSKYLILRPSQLDFHKSYEGKNTLTIYLKDVTGVSRYDDIPLCVEITRVANPNSSSGVAPRDAPQKTVYLQFKNDEELYEWQDSIYTRCPTISGVSNPTNFSHRVHVGFDPTNGSFVGLPKEWEKLLTTSAITKEDYAKHPQAVLEVLDFYTEVSKRKERPDIYPSLTPTPPVTTAQNMQLGYGGGGTAIAPPRPQPPAMLDRQASYQYQQQQRYALEGISRSQTGTPVQGQRSVSSPEKRFDPNQAGQQSSNSSKLGLAGDMKRAMEEEARRVKEVKEQRDRERQREEDEQNRRDMEAYNAAIPKARVPMAQQEVGGYGGSVESATRYTPSRNAPSTPNGDRNRQPPQSSTRQITAQRQAPQAPPQSNGVAQGPRAPFAQKQASSREQSPSGSQASLRIQTRPEQQPRQPSPAQRPPVNGADRTQSPQTRAPPNGLQLNGNAQVQPSRAPAPVQQVKPLNVATKQGAPQPQQKAVPDAVKQAEIALTAPKKPEARQREVRMSSMTENEVMEKLRQVVTRQDPSTSYSKQKKIGQGASGSVYVAKILPSATSEVAHKIYRDHGAKSQVAIKTMDLRNQPRKELIVNEIIVMKESSHPNIVNYLDAFLMEGNNELWVVMEYMEGGALTDVIDNNPNITEPQIATICREVSGTVSLSRLEHQLTLQQTCKGLAHLHNQDIIHRDIKSDNVLLDGRGNVKISKCAAIAEFSRTEV